MNPLYNVLLYVPNTAVDPIPQGVSCNTCNSPISGTPVAAGLSDATGHFVIDNAPHGTNVPLVIQIGKWRRQVTLPTVTACQDNPFNDPQKFRLPRKQSEGDLPQIAISTGHADALDCFLRRVGIDDTEFTADTGTGRVHMYAGGDGMSGNEGSTTLASGATLANSYSKLFPSFTQMSKYDIIVLTCESSQLESSKDPYLLNMKRYADSGGKSSPSTCTRTGSKGAAPLAGHRRLGPERPARPGRPDQERSADPEIVDTTFPKGTAMADWLVTTKASTTRGQISRRRSQNSIDSVNPPRAAVDLHDQPQGDDAVHDRSTRRSRRRPPTSAAA